MLAQEYKDIDHLNAKAPPLLKKGFQLHTLSTKPGHLNFGRTVMKFLFWSNVTAVVLGLPVLFTIPFALPMVLIGAVIMGLVLGISRTKPSLVATYIYRADLDESRAQAYFA